MNFVLPFVLALAGYTGAVGGADADTLAYGSAQSFSGTVLEETEGRLAVIPDEDEAESGIAERFAVTYPMAEEGFEAGTGQKVVVYYTVPENLAKTAEIAANDISMEGYRKFTLFAEPSEEKERRLIGMGEEKPWWSEEMISYDIYYYGLSEVTAAVDGKAMPLEQALADGKVTSKGILHKAHQDAEEGRVKWDAYRDGGSMDYEYEGYSIIKYNRSEERDLYICCPGMKLYHLDKMYGRY